MYVVSEYDSKVSQPRSFVKIIGDLAFFFSVYFAFIVFSLNIYEIRATSKTGKEKFVQK